MNILSSPSFGKFPLTCAKKKLHSGLGTKQTALTSSLLQESSFCLTKLKQKNTLDSIKVNVFSSRAGGDSSNSANTPQMPEKNASNLIRRYIIVGERRLSNYWWTSVIFLGACGFLYTGISAYFGESIFDLIFHNTESEMQPFGIPFFPQGLLMSFYGSLGLLLCFYWLLLIFWNVGGGFNEFNKKDGLIRIFRWGYPGKNRKIDYVYSLKDVEAIRVEIKQGFDPQRTIYLKVKGNPISSSKIEPGSEKSENSNTGKNSPTTSGRLNSAALLREIPLTGISQPLTLKEIEKQASELANFLQVSLEGL